MLRLLTAAVLAPLLWVLIKIAPARTFQIVALLVILGACWECYRLLTLRGAKPFAWLGLTATLGVGWTFLGEPPEYRAVLPLVIVTLLSMLIGMWRRESSDEVLDSSMATLFPVVFVGLSLTYLLGLRGQPGADGEDLVLMLFLCVTLGDTGAYYVGSAIGRHRMAPTLSPKKSWEGAAGGIASSVVAALLAHLWFYQRLPLGHALILGVLLGAAGILGDLAESAVKRAAGAKDSSGLVPGHGGILDRMDSLLFSAPVLYYYYFAFLQGAA